MLRSIRFAGLASCLLTSSAFATSIAKRADLKPVITTDFPDPSIIKVDDTWYAFGSQSAYDFKNIRVQLATSTDFDTWTLTGTDALDTMAPWARSSVWAPSVHQRVDGTFIMYYSAVTTTAGNGQYHCVGTAVSDRVEGPYHSNSPEPFACPTEQGGALDASYFRDGEKYYVLYKIDANAKGHGGECGNTVAPIVKTPIMIQEVQSDGTTKIGNPKEILNNSALDGPLVEAPYMIKTEEGIYFLFFSSQCWTTEKYDVSYATSQSIWGPFEKTGTPLFVTGTLGMIGPGGASVADDGEHFALHGYTDRGKVGSVRALYVTRIRAEGRGVGV